ncbi:MAG: hypothetical protein ACYST6_09010 [Planctomycetota bacterium]|jgi:hypothetical protein
METLEEQSQPKVSSKPMTFGLLRAYYIATPLFLIIELLSGISLRVPIFLSMPLRCFYYGCCFACGTVCYLRPHAAPVVALTESTINIFLIFVGFGAAVISGAFLVAETTTIPEVLTLKGIVNFITVGAIWVISFYHSQALLQKRFQQKNKL